MQYIFAIIQQTKCRLMACFPKSFPPFVAQLLGSGMLSSWLLVNKHNLARGEVENQSWIQTNLYTELAAAHFCPPKGVPGSANHYRVDSTPVPTTCILHELNRNITCQRRSACSCDHMIELCAYYSFTERSCMEIGDLSYGPEAVHCEGMYKRSPAN